MKPYFVKIVFAAVGQYLATTLSFGQPKTLNVPFKVSEALTASAFGVTRSAEPVTVGVPIADRYNIQSANVLGVAGASTYQFRVLDRWPSGNVKWVLVDFLADVSANQIASQYALTFGTGASGGPDLAQETNGNILVNTGTMKVEIGKTNFNLFREVFIDGISLVARDKSPGIILTGADGVIYASKNDPSSRVIIEENGPVRAVIKAEGAHHSANGKKFLDYTVRMHFIKGKSRIRLFYTLRNANRLQVLNAGVRYLDLQIKTTLTNGQFQFPTHTNNITGTLTARDSAAIYQAYSSYPQIIDFGFVSPIPQNGETYAQEGYRITKNLAPLANAGRDNFPDLFYGKLSGPQGGAVAGIRFAAGWWPKSLQSFADGAIAVGLWPKQNPNPTYIRFSSHNTFEVLFEFSKDAGVDAAMAMQKFQYPLVANAPVSWYNESQALYEKIVSFAEERTFYTAQGWPADSRRPGGWPVGGLQIYRHKYWGEGGGGNQYDFTRINLINFIREDKHFRGEYYLMAEQRLHYNADGAAYHSDNFDPGLRDVPELAGRYGDYLDWPDKDSDKVSTAKVIFEGEHRHWYGMALYYYLTGDERFRDAVMDWAEYLVASSTQTDEEKWMRVLAWNIFGLTELFRFTHEQKYLDLARQLFDEEIANPTAIPNQSAGFDWTRGYFVDRNSVEGKSRVLSIFAHSAILYRALQLLYDELPWSDPNKSRVGDVLTGISWFTYHELWFDYGQTAGDFGYPYLYNLDNPPPADVRTVDAWWGGMREIFEVTAKGYELTGDSRFLTRVQKMLKNCAYNTMGVYWYQDYPGLQQMLYLVKNQATQPIWQPLPLSVTRNNNGSYTLSWTVPKEARRIQIKYSDKQLVEWLGFDRKARTYQYNPVTHQAYFAAMTLANVPLPNAAGTQQSMTVANLPANKTYNFLAKAYIDKNLFTAVHDQPGNQPNPTQFRLWENFPNPFNPETSIRFDLPRAAKVTAIIFDSLGQEMVRLLDQPMNAGSHSLKWNSRNKIGQEVGSGIYFLRLQADENIATIKMLLVR